jgi:hypothetical protein
VAVDSVGNLVFPDETVNRIEVVAEQPGTFYGQAMTAGHIYTVAGDGTKGYSGDGGPATSAELFEPGATAVDGAGNLAIADIQNNRIRLVAEQAGTFYGQAMTAGDIYTVGGNGVAMYSGNGGPATAAEFASLSGVALSPSAGLVISEAGNNRVRMVAGQTGTFYGKAMKAGDVYALAGNGVRGRPILGRVATATPVEPSGVAIDAAGNVLIADTAFNRILVVPAASGTFYGQAMIAGDIYTIAGDGGFGGYSGDGGPAAAAELNWPGGVAVDAAGNVLIPDTRNDRVRVVAEQAGTFYGVLMTTGDIYTIAGTGVAAFSGDGGPATSAEVGIPTGIAVSSAGDLIFCDSHNDRVREVAG